MAFYPGPFLPLLDIGGNPLTEFDFCSPPSGEASHTKYGPGATYNYSSYQSWASQCSTLGSIPMLLLHHVTTIFSEGESISSSYPENQYFNVGLNSHYKQDPYVTPEEYIVYHNYSHYSNNAGWTLIVSNIRKDGNYWRYNYTRSESRWYFVRIYDTPTNVCPPGTVYNDITKTCDVLPGYIWDGSLGAYVLDEDYCENVSCETISFTPTHLGSSCSSYSEPYEYTCNYFPGGVLDINVQIENIELSSLTPPDSFIALYSGGIEIGRLTVAEIQAGSIVTHAFTVESNPITINNLGTLMIHQAGGIDFDITVFSAIGSNTNCYLPDTNVDGTKPDLECFYIGPPGLLPPENNCRPVAGCVVPASVILVPDNIEDATVPGYDIILELDTSNQEPLTGDCELLIDDCYDVDINEGE